MNDSSPPDIATDEGITMTRVLDAPREEVWREWTEPERFADWFGGSGAEIPIDTVSMDVREGGEWRATMHAAGREIHWHGEYREVVEPERLAVTMSDEPGDESDLITATLADLGDGRTEMRVEQSGGSMSAAGYERAMEGWGGFFARMAERLAEG